MIVIVMTMLLSLGSRLGYHNVVVMGQLIDLYQVIVIVVRNDNGLMGQLDRLIVLLIVMMLLKLLPFVV